uniref:Cytochrome b-c1 complex subunit 8 n=1 Tax=Nelumbo nucifera TaxID=4432 RepID=A0A822Z363_NELNU|nr:TPA_asm: hypothetical protein HUJ06_013443 [Nelumbo nucifera]
MGKTPVRMKAVVYSLSPFQQKVMPGLWKDLPDKIHKKISENWISAVLLLTPLVGTYTHFVHVYDLLKEDRYHCILSRLELFPGIGIFKVNMCT